MRAISFLLLCILIIAAFMWGWVNYSPFKNWVVNLSQQKKFKTLEIRYSAENIMKIHKRELLKDSEHTFLEPKLIFHPYLLMEVKYNKSQDKTGEGIILWSLVDGEMVINTNSWEKTHGFTDCIRAGASRDDFKVINALAHNNGFMYKDILSRYLNVEEQTLNAWLYNCKQKNLIVQNGNFIRLHFQNPKLHVIPETKLNLWLVTKEFRRAKCISQKYRKSQIEQTAKAAFGPDFSVRKTTEIFLPVHSIKIQNPDGSQMTTYWNALNGKRLPKSLFIE